MTNWYVLFVQAGEEKVVCMLLNKLYKHICIAFYPKVKRIYFNKKKASQELRPMFPGYIFVESEMSAITFIQEITPIIKKSKLIFNLLGKENPRSMGLCNEEKSLLLKFCDDEYIVEGSIGYVEGDRVYVTSGPLQGLESIIKRIDRHKRIAEIQMQLMGDIRRIKVALEVVKKI